MQSPCSHTCFYGLQEFIWKVEVGLHNRCEDRDEADDGYQAVWVPRKRLTMSPSYNKETKEADYAILELVPEIRLNPAFAMPACFPKHPPVPNMMATVTGWGKTSGKCMHTAYQDDTVNFCLTNAAFQIALQIHSP